MLLWRLEFQSYWRVKSYVFVMFSPTGNLLVSTFGLYLEVTSQLICFFLKLCHRGYSVQKTPIKISSFRAATTPRVWENRKTKQSKNNDDREQVNHEQVNSERTEVKWRFSELLSDGSQICMTVHADERKFGRYVLIMNLPVNANLSDIVWTKIQP